MRERRLRFVANDMKPQAELMKTLMDEVTDEKRGAFSLLSQYPVLAAILLPSGSIGAWALLEYLAKTFA